MNGLGPVIFSLCSSSFFDALGSVVALSRRPACRPAITLERAPKIRAETVLCGPQELTRNFNGACFNSGAKTLDLVQDGRN